MSREPARRVAVLGGEVEVGLLGPFGGVDACWAKSKSRARVWETARREESVCIVRKRSKDV